MQLLQRLGMKTEQLQEMEVKAAKVPCSQAKA
jgi:hypothetical protein